MLRLFLNSCSLNVNLLADITSSICFLTGERPLNFGELALKDLKTLQTFNEVLVEFFANNFSRMQEEFTNERGATFLKQFKEACASEPLTESFA